jgi:hypothetical protein
VPKINGDEFAGLYGYQMTFVHAGFLSERYVLFTSEFKGMERIYVLDVQTKQIRMLDFLGKQEASYTLFNRRKNTIVFKFNKFNLPSKIYSATFKNTDAASLDDLMAPENIADSLLESVSYAGE